MRNDEIVKALRCCVMNACSACPADNGDPMDIECAGCVMGAAADLIEKLTDRCARYAEEIAVLQARQKWIPVAERLPEVWRNDETAEIVNYLIYSPDFGVDVGNYHAKAKKWFCVALPCTVTHWMPLPDGPEVE